MAKNVAIAYQGGGSHTAFTAGALKRLLKEDEEKYHLQIKTVDTVNMRISGKNEKTTSNETWRGHALRIVLGIAVIALLLQSVNLSAANSPSKIKNVSSETGVTVTQKVPFIKESIADIKLRESRQPARIPKQRVIPFHKGPPPEELHGIAPLNPQNAPQFGNVTSSLASNPSNSFIGLNTIGKGAILHQPPDFYQPSTPPDTTGAAGPSYLMEMTNDEVGFFDNSNGTLISSTTLQAFWSSLGGTRPGQPANSLTDPKVIYDQYSGSFIAVTLGAVSSPPSWLMLGISATSDPTGTWYKWKIDANEDVGIQTDNWADYPGLGVDADNVYITANMYDSSGNYSYSKVWVINKTQLYKTQLLNGSNSNDSSNITFTPFSDYPGSGFTTQPAHAFGASSAEYLINEVHEGIPSSSAPRRFLNISRITFSGGTPTWTYLGLIEVNSYPTSNHLPYAPQLGSSNLADTGDPRLLNAVFSNGYLWTTHTVSDDNNTKTEVAWYQIDPANASEVNPGTPAQDGRISDPDLWYYYPSIAVNSSDYVVIGFSGSSSGEYIGAYYTARNASDEPDTMQSVRRLKKGEYSYNGSTTGKPCINCFRWGDYSATVVDPTDDSTFWTVQAYAYYSDPPLWGTWWGKISPGLSTSANQDTVTVGTPTNVTFNATNSDGTPVSGATVTLSGSATGTGITDAAGSTVIRVNATAAGTIYATANKTGHKNATTTLNAVGS